MRNGNTKFRYLKFHTLWQSSVKRYNEKITVQYKVLVFADKTSNIYKLDMDEFKKLTTEAITSTYKKVPDKINNNINTEGKRIMENKTA